MIAETSGAGSGAEMMNALWSMPDCLSGFITTTFHGPGAAPGGMGIVQVMWFGETTVLSIAPMAFCPFLINFTIAPGWK
jgi:hypothetical protein